MPQRPHRTRRHAEGSFLLGISVGVVAALAATRALASMLVGVRANDPVTYVGVAVLLAVTALAASWVPARRAARVDPMVAIRAE